MLPQELWALWTWNEKEDTTKHCEHYSTIKSRTAATQVRLERSLIWKRLRLKLFILLSVFSGTAINWLNSILPLRFLCGRRQVWTWKQVWRWRQTWTCRQIWIWKKIWSGVKLMSCFVHSVLLVFILTLQGILNMCIVINNHLSSVAIILSDVPESFWISQKFLVGFLCLTLWSVDVNKCIIGWEGLYQIRISAKWRIWNR